MGGAVGEIRRLWVRAGTVDQGDQPQDGPTRRSVLNQDPLDDRHLQLGSAANAVGESSRVRRRLSNEDLTFGPRERKSTVTALPKKYPDELPWCAAGA